MSLYTNSDLDSLLIRSKSNLYNKIRVLFVSFEDGIDSEKISTFFEVATKQANLIAVLGSDYPESVQTSASLLNEMKATNASTEYYFGAGYTSNY